MKSLINGNKYLGADEKKFRGSEESFLLSLTREMIQSRGETKSFLIEKLLQNEQNEA